MHFLFFLESRSLIPPLAADQTFLSAGMTGTKNVLKNLADYTDITNRPISVLIDATFVRRYHGGNPEPGPHWFKYQWIKEEAK